MSSLAQILQNPSKPEFLNTYGVLGRVEGKKQYVADCQRLKIRISPQAMQILEKGFSRKARISYSNDYDVNSSIANWGDQSKRQYSNKKDLEKAIQEKKAKEEEEIEKEKALALEKAKEEKKVRIAKKKATKFDKMKKKMSQLESWEDL